MHSRRAATRCRATIIWAVCFFVLLGRTTLADDWPNWRGPSGDGVASGENFPTHWDEKKNVAWKVALPGVGGSTPIVWRDAILLTSPNGASDLEKQQLAKNTVFCFDRSGGQVWQRSFDAERPGKHKKGSGSNPSPVTDGHFVFCYFKSGDLACLDFHGKVMWKKNLQAEFGKDTLWWDLGTSPVLTDDAVVIACVQSGPSYLVAFDKASGTMLWKQDRLLNAPSESNQTYSTPVVVGSGHEQQLLVLGADHVTGHEARTGRELWRVGGLNPQGDKFFRSISSPVICGNLLAVPYARGRTLTGIRLGGAGDVTASHVAWTIASHSSDVPTPAAKDGVLYVLTDRGMLAAIDGASGKVLRETRLPKHRDAYSASPIIAGDNLYALREDGTCYVVHRTTLDLVGENRLPGPTVATPVFVDGSILVRSAMYLYCIQGPAP